MLFSDLIPLRGVEGGFKGDGVNSFTRLGVGNPA